jgi:predicted small lipoprotein YifL
MSETEMERGRHGQRRTGRHRPAPHLAVRLALVLVVGLALTGCGRKGNPQPPPGEPNAYPRTYPSY